MSIKKIFFLLVAALLASCEDTGCESNPTPKTELEKLPPITQTGENTFGCLVNGKAFVSETTTDAVAFYQMGILQIIGGLIDEEISFIIHEDNTPILSGKYDLVNNSLAEASFYSYINGNTCIYTDKNVITGTLTITQLNLQQFILAGTFEFDAVTTVCDTVKITDGRFDLSLIL
jgi:hypothetical protein